MKKDATRAVRNNIELLLAWTFRTVRARYQQSILGGLWAVFQPIATAAILTVVFSSFIRVNTGDIPYVVFAYTALVPWFLFSSSLTDMVESIVTNMNLVVKIYFRREILVVSCLLARLLDFCLAFAVLLVMMLYYQMPVFSSSWVYLPGLLAAQLALALGLGLIGAALNVFFRDVRHVIVLAIQLWFYCTPIIYPVSMVPERFQKYYYLNPMVAVIEGYRAVMFRGVGPGAYWMPSAAIAGAVLVLGYWFFRQVEHRFADVI